MPCPRCRKPRTYNDKHDAYYCAACDVWLENGCRDAACVYCGTRPDANASTFTLGHLTVEYASAKRDTGRSLATR